MGKPFPAAAIALCVACGGGTDNSNSVNGTVSGESLNARDAVSNVVQVGSQSVGVVRMTSAANTCPVLTANHQIKNCQALLFEIGVTGGASSIISAPSLTGAYPVYSSVGLPVSGKFAVVDFAVVDATCTAAANLEAQSGTVTLTRIDANGYSGTFDATFAGGHLTGSFNTNLCTPFGTAVNTTCPP
jgi:hypothetical protein